MKLLKVQQISDLKTDKRGRKFYTLKFTTTTILHGLTIFSNQSPKTRNIWGEFTDESGNTFKADSLFNDIVSGNLVAGALVEGSIYNFQTTPYELDNRTVNSYSTVIFDNENPHNVANRELRDAFASTIDGDVVVAPNNLRTNVASVLN